MDDLNELVRKFTIRHDRFIKRLCNPLKIHLGIPIFVYYTIEEDGRLCILSNYPEQLEFFYHEKLYLYQPYLNHPKFFRSGYAITQATHDLESLKKCEELFKYRESFLILQQHVSKVEGFLFASATIDPLVDFLSHIELLNKFANYFKRETQLLFEQMRSENYNLEKAKGAAFMIGDTSLPLSSHNPAFSKFLSTLSPLSPREQQCVNLYLQGHSAQSTAAMLNLSQRTVEHYFENIKNKLGCSSKRELLGIV